MSLPIMLRILNFEIDNPSGNPPPFLKPSGFVLYRKSKPPWISMHFHFEDHFHFKDPPGGLVFLGISVEPPGFVLFENLSPLGFNFEDPLDVRYSQNGVTDNFWKSPMNLMA